MKYFILLAVLAFIYTNGLTQSFTKSCATIRSKLEDVKPYTDEGGMLLTVSGPDKASVLNLLKKSIIKKDTAETLYSMAARLFQTKSPDDSIKNNGKTTAEKFIFKYDLKAVRPQDADSLTLMFSCDGKIIDTIPLKRNKENKNDLKKKDTQGAANPSYTFIPPDSLEAKWSNSNYYTRPQAPLLNKHTRWAIVYDYTKQDPVAVWKRTNKVAGTTCDEFSNQKTSKKDKKHKELSDIAKEIYDIDTALSNLQSKIKDEILQNGLNKLKGDLTEFKKELINAPATEKTYENALIKITSLRGELEKLKAFSPEFQPEKPLSNQRQRNTSSINTAIECCDKIYCIKEVKRLAPTVGRNLLISVINYHPYRDSFVLAVDYNDRFTENAALFSSAFNAAGGLGAATSSSSGTTESTTNKQQAKEDSDTLKKIDYKKEFNVLGNELKQYYDNKFQQDRLDVSIVANGMGYIKSRMADTAVLGIKDFSEAGIIKRAEELSDIQKSNYPETNLDDYFKSARFAASWFSKVSNYRIFDSKSILVQNRDVINVTLNRYNNGRLNTIANEALRSYHTSSGFKIDFSAGLFGSGLINKSYTTVAHIVMDTAYFQNPNGTINRDSIVAIDSIEKRRIIKDNLGKFDIGPAVFLHGYWRTGIDINMSGTFGLSINQSGSPRFLLGVSALFGKDSRWVVSAGGAWSKIKDLASGYIEDQVIPTSVLLQNSTLPTKDVWKSNCFIAVSWNFGGFTVGNNH